MLTYRVRRGDNLWTISKNQLGDATQWPRIWQYNNRRDVIARTGRGVPDPDLIYPDQQLLIPVLPGFSGGHAASTHTAASHAGHPTSNTQPSNAGRPQPLHRGSQPDGPLSQQLPHVRSPISFKYKLDDIKFPPIHQPGFTLEMKMTGDVVLISRATAPALYVTNRHEIELQMTSQANHAFGALINDTRLVYDGPGNKVTYRSMLVSQSNIPHTPATAVGIEINSQSPIPSSDTKYVCRSCRAVFLTSSTSRWA